MNVQERIYTLRLLEKIKENSEYAKTIGLKVINENNRTNKQRMGMKNLRRNKYE